MSADRKQPENEEIVSLNADDLDGEKQEKLKDDKLEDVSGGGCGNNSCWIYSES